jgi:hypothetical protein
MVSDNAPFLPQEVIEDCGGVCTVLIFVAIEDENFKSDREEGGRVQSQRVG